MMNKRAPRRSDEEWHQIILAARASGLSDFEYCRDNSIPSSSFYRALARLRQQACELPARSERSECKQEVVPINISELPISRADQIHPVSHMVDEPLPDSFEATMRITLGGGTLEFSATTSYNLFSGRSILECGCLAPQKRPFSFAICKLVQMHLISEYIVPAISCDGQ